MRKQIFIWLVILGCNGTPENRPPTVVLSAEPKTGYIPLSVKFSAVAEDPDGKVVKFKWEFGDGTKDVTKNPSVEYTYNSSGTFIVKVIAVDNKGAEGEASITIEAREKEGEEIAPGVSIKITEKNGYKFAEIVEEESSIDELLAEGKFSEAKELICKVNGSIDCKKAVLDKGIEDVKDFSSNVIVITVNTGEIIEVADTVLETLALGTIEPWSSIMSPRLSTKQEDVVDTVLSMLGIDREKLETFASEIDLAVTNIENWGQGKGKSTKFILPEIPVKIENTINVIFKDVVIDWDEIQAIGAIARLFLSALKFINTHNLRLSMSDVITKITEFIEELKDNTIGFLRHLAYYYNFEDYPNFLKFGDDSYCERLYGKGCTYAWKDIPFDFSIASARLKNTFEYFFNPENWCGYEKDFVCFYDSATPGKIGGYADKPEGVDDDYWCEQKGGDCIKFNVEHGGTIFNEPTKGYLAHPGKFTDTEKNALILFLGSISEELDCKNGFEISLGDISRLLELVRAIEFEIPNFALFDICKFFGWGGSPKPLRDMFLEEFPCEEDGGKYYCFALEAEVPEGTTTVIPIGAGEEFNGIYKVGDRVFGISITQIVVYGQSITKSEGELLKVASQDSIVAVTAPADINVIFLRSSWVGISGDITLKHPYIFSGDSGHFRGLKEVSSDFLKPLASKLSYPEEITLGDITSEKLLIYILPKDPTFNGSLKIDICELEGVGAESLKARYTCGFTTPSAQLFSDTFAAIQIWLVGKKINIYGR